MFYMMKIFSLKSDMFSIGIDLAGKTCNPTGFCVLVEKNKEVMCLKTLYSDEEILKEIFFYPPVETIVAVDAPLMKNGIPKMRMADKLLKKYGAMPPTMKSMICLSIRAYTLSKKLENMRYKIIEVFPTATAKILGIYDKSYVKMSRILKVEVKNRHELDAYLCALTGKLFLEYKTTEVGDMEGKIIIPLEGLTINWL
ncbi:MAG: DUF429 domain-containing protein [Thermoplasmata archaeon]|nr:MAG: DUF429 domain-containing protein [Thermoplasmata archaeon]